MIDELIQQNGGKLDTHVAKFGATVLDNHKSLEHYKINTNGNMDYHDTNWNGIKYELFSI